MCMRQWLQSSSGGGGCGGPVGPPAVGRVCGDRGAAKQCVALHANCGVLQVVALCNQYDILSIMLRRVWWRGGQHQSASDSAKLPVPARCPCRGRTAACTWGYWWLRILRLQFVLSLSLSFVAPWAAISSHYGRGGTRSRAPPPLAADGARRGEPDGGRPEERVGAQQPPTPGPAQSAGAAQPPSTTTPALARRPECWQLYLPPA